MQKQVILGFSLLFLATLPIQAQKTAADSTYKKCFAGSSLFVLYNLIPNASNAPDFAQLNLGYRITRRDVVSIEAITWKYRWPLGIPIGASYESPEEKYPGYIRDYGIALVYQRFWWKGAYTAVHALNALQKYVNEDGRKIQNGYQLFITYRLGYQIKLFKNLMFLEPSVAMTHWPIKTNTPESFAVKESKWPNYFMVEPGLHFGVNF